MKHWTPERIQFQTRQLWHNIFDNEFYVEIVAHLQKQYSWWTLHEIRINGKMHSLSKKNSKDDKSTILKKTSRFSSFLIL